MSIRGIFPYVAKRKKGDVRRSDYEIEKGSDVAGNSATGSQIFHKSCFQYTTNVYSCSEVDILTEIDAQ